MMIFIDNQIIPIYNIGHIGIRRGKSEHEESCSPLVLRKEYEIDRLSRNIPGYQKPYWMDKDTWVLIIDYRDIAGEIKAIKKYYDTEEQCLVKAQEIKAAIAKITGSINAERIEL